MIRTAALSLAALLAAPAFAQITLNTPPGPPTPPMQSHREPRVMELRMPRADDPTTSSIAPSGTWWRDAETIKSLNLTADQQRKMDDTFRQNRIQLIDLKASLEKEQLNLEPLLNANPPDSGKAMAEISRIADLRAELEKANARMLLGLRTQLTADQWTKLHSLHPVPAPFSVNMPKFTFRNDSAKNFTTTTCTQTKAGGPQDCTTVTVTHKEDAGKPVVVTCVQTPGQTTPKCTTNHGQPTSSFDMGLAWDGIATPPARLTIDTPRGAAVD